MKAFSVSLMTTVALTLSTLPVAAQLASWDTVITGATRFKVLSAFNNAAVLDRETGLVWERSPDTRTWTWLDARRFCVDRSVGSGNRKGWRLPTVQEILTLVDPTRNPPSLPAGHPFTNVQPDDYWSATTFGVNTDLAWAAGFENDTTEPGARFAGKTQQLFAWCVRTPFPGSDVQ